jgi:outer membrane receptor protein involved in Fe transport
MRRVNRNLIKTLSTTALMMTALQAGGDILPVVEYTNYEEVNAVEVMTTSPVTVPMVHEQVTKEVLESRVEPKVVTPTAIVPALATVAPRDNFYVGLGVNAEQTNTHRFGKDRTLGATVKMGYDVSKYLGLELRGSKSFTKEDPLTHDYSVGAYLKPQYPVTKELTLYGLVGYGETKVTYENELAEQGIANNETKQRGLSYGLGLDYMIDNSWSVFADASRLIDKKITKLEGKYAVKVDNVTLGFAKRF